VAADAAAADVNVSPPASAAEAENAASAHRAVSLRMRDAPFPRGAIDTEHYSARWNVPDAALERPVSRQAAA
jgi:hypothetical protein